MNTYLDRIARAQEILRAERLAAAVFAPTDQMRYLTGWAENAHERLLALFVPADGNPAFVVPSLNAAQARTNAAGIDDVRAWDDSAGWNDIVLDLFEDWDVEEGLAIDDELYSVHLLALQSLIPRERYVAASDLMARLREVKSADELAIMERSAAVTDAVYEEALSALREGISERELQDVITRAYKKRGTHPEFAIVGFGPNTALPHHSVSDRPLQRGDVVLMDIGCKIEGYGSDITRTVAFGEPQPEARRVYEIVHAAFRAAFEAGRPGVTCEQVDRAARQVIIDAGYGEYFIHRTGHGIGLSGHEGPYIVEGNKHVLREGMCFSDEPGIYLLDRFGVRIENVVTVTADGLRSLDAAPPTELLVITPS